MNWQDIKISADNTHFLFKGNPIFGKKFIEVLKFHAPGLAPVQDESGSYHINSNGNSLYAHRFSRAFGFYCNRAAVVYQDRWFHITENGERAYAQSYSWAGNFQENLCTVRDDNSYFHINPDGKRTYSENFIYCGDFKDGFACVKTMNGMCRHIDCTGKYLNNKLFLDLGVFHKNFATAKDSDGWFHIDKTGKELYPQRYLAVEPFYNGFALVTMHDQQKIIIDEEGKKILSV